MLANVLKSARAVTISRRVIDVFILLRESLVSQTEIKLEIELIKKKLNNQGKNMEILFKYIDELLENKRISKPRNQIGFKIKK